MANRETLRSPSPLSPLSFFARIIDNCYVLQFFLERM
jgi:hypothetical protein